MGLGTDNIEKGFGEVRRFSPSWVLTLRLCFYRALYCLVKSMKMGTSKTPVNKNGTTYFIGDWMRSL